MDWIKYISMIFVVLLLASIAVSAIGIGVVIALLQRGPIEIPQMRNFVETRLNAQFAEQTVAIGSVSLKSGDSIFSNRVYLTDVFIRDSTGRPVLAAPEVNVSLSLRALFQGQLVAQRISIIGPEFSFDRLSDGSISAFGDALGQGEWADNLRDSLNSHPVLLALQDIRLLDTKISLHDRKSSKTWVFDGLSFAISRENGKLQMSTELSLSGQDRAGVPKGVFLLNAEYRPGSDSVSVSLQADQVQSSEIADFFQSPAWLQNLDAKLAGSIRATVSSKGQLRELNGVVEITDGKLTQVPTSLPAGFGKAKVYFEYDPLFDSLNLSQMQVDSSSGGLSGTGYAQMRRSETGSIESISGQLRMTDIKVNRRDWFERAVEISEVALDTRISFAPLKIEIGNLTVLDQGSAIKVRGVSIAGKTYWNNRYDIDVDKIELARFKELWPMPVHPKFRSWFEKNTFSGQFTNFGGGLRSVDGSFEYAANFGMKNANFRFLKFVSNLESGNGYGYLTHRDLRLDLQSGFVTAPDSTRVDMSGSRLFIPDIYAVPTSAEITLHAKGHISGALELLDLERFRLVQKIGQTPDIADGNAFVSGTLKYPLIKHVKFSDMVMDLKVELSDVKSEKLLENRLLTARQMTAVISEKEFTLSGDAFIQGVPFTVTWTQKYGKGVNSGSKAAVQVEISEKNLQNLGVQLPKGIVQGETRGVIGISLKKGQPAQFSLSSDLVGASLDIPALGWSKPADSKGQLTITGSFDGAVNVDGVSLEAKDLNVIGTVELNATGGVQMVRFSSLTVGDFLKTSIIIVPKGNGSSEIVLDGGSADLRFLGKNVSSISNLDQNTSIKLNLDRLRLTNELWLSEVSAELQTAGGLRGSFSGRVNGGTQVKGVLYPEEHGTAIELASNDAGGVMASANFLQNARGGTLRLVLSPQTGLGNYDGTLNITQIRLKDNSAMVELLNAISIIGLLQQLEGEGIHFATVEGQFKLRGHRVMFESISAVGPSIGLTLEGWYDTVRKSVDFEGVLTPFYVINGLFERLLGPLIGRGKGDGIFSFTYQMRGLAANPKVSVNPLSVLIPGVLREVLRVKPLQQPAE